MSSQRTAPSNLFFSLLSSSRHRKHADDMHCSIQGVSREVQGHTWTALSFSPSCYGRPDSRQCRKEVLLRDGASPGGLLSAHSSSNPPRNFAEPFLEGNVCFCLVPGLEGFMCSERLAQTWAGGCDDSSLRASIAASRQTASKSAPE